MIKDMDKTKLGDYKKAINVKNKLYEVLSYYDADYVIDSIKDNILRNKPATIYMLAFDNNEDRNNQYKKLIEESRYTVKAYDGKYLANKAIIYVEYLFND